MRRDSMKHPPNEFISFIRSKFDKLSNFEVVVLPLIYIVLHFN